MRWLEIAGVEAIGLAWVFLFPLVLCCLSLIRIVRRRGDDHPPGQVRDHD